MNRDIIMKRNGKPFEHYRAVCSRKSILEKQGINTEVLQVEGGFALERLPKDEPKSAAEEQPKDAVKTEESPKEEIKEQPKEETPRKRNRVPLGRRNILKYPHRPGYHRRVVNDVDDRVLMFQEGGYEIVNDKDIHGGDPRCGEPTRMGLSARKPVGGGVTGVLMEIPEDWYREDQQMKQDEIKRLEDTMKREKGGFDRDGTYGEVKIR